MTAVPSPKVLIVDDTPANLVALRKLLSKLGAEVIPANNGNEALARTLEHSFAVILLDVQMPGMDGFELATILKEDERTSQVPIIFVTASYRDEEHRLQAYKVGAIDYIEKPINDSILLSKVSLFLDLHKARKQIQTELARSEAILGHLRESEATVRAVIDSSPDAIVTMNRDGNIVDFNPAAEITFGWARAQAVGRQLGDLIVPPGLRQAHKAGHRRYLETGQPSVLGRRLELTAVRSDGSEFPVEMTITEVEGQQFVGFLRDITERRRREAIQAARLRLLELESHSSLNEMLVATLDEVGDLTASPIGFYHFLASDQKTLSLQAWSTRTSKEFCKAIASEQHYAVDQAGVWVDCIHQRKAVIHNDYASLPHRRGLPPGHAPVLRELVVPIFRKGLIVAVLGVGNKDLPYTHADLETVTQFADLAFDLAERRRGTEELESQREELKRSNSELEQFAYVVSHDLREPLRMISSYTQLLSGRMGDRLTSDEQDFFNFIHDGAIRMDNMLASLLEYSRVGRRGEPLTELDSRTLAEEALQFLTPAIEGTGATISLAGDWPTVVASRNEIVRLFQNLIGNALKYHHPDHRPVITLTAEPHERGWQFTIQDDGIGISPEHFGRLFKVFQRLHTRAEFQGTGIGLAVCRKIVERHGGTIWVESEGADRGTAFRFTLPRSTGLIGR